MPLWLAFSWQSVKQLYCWPLLAWSMSARSAAPLHFARHVICQNCPENCGRRLWKHKCVQLSVTLQDKDKSLQNIYWNDNIGTNERLIFQICFCNYPPPTPTPPSPPRPPPPPIHPDVRSMGVCNSCHVDNTGTPSPATSMRFMATTSTDAKSHSIYHNDICPCKIPCYLWFKI